jgi:hypothetical protein
MRQRKIASVKYDDLKKMGVVLKRAKYFLTCSGRYFGDCAFDPVSIRRALCGPEDAQISLFDVRYGNKLGGGYDKSLDAKSDLLKLDPGSEPGMTLGENKLELPL